MSLSLHWQKLLFANNNCFLSKVAGCSNPLDLELAKYRTVSWTFQWKIKRIYSLWWSR